MLNSHPLDEGLMMNTKSKRKLLWAVVLTALSITWLPYFGVFNTASMVMGLPQPLAVIIASNIVLTVCVILIYPLYFKPFIKKLEEKPLHEEAVK
ncbi:MAG: hypothetical protein ACQEXC_02895 [Pseudomonadota bacterium]|uniref:Uncharacterized protein n=1 Tax=Vreelandella nigrificans TaxID=2042704 RepID=A0A2A4HLC9_9GAMM|nr:hypothetical protein [Halomonas nigrificans]PCF95169.1 hypothetical protein CPA45_13970 [Halomonas nigrificans]